MGKAAWYDNALADPASTLAGSQGWHTITAAASVVQVKSYAYVDTAIVGWYSKLGHWTHVENHAVLGEDVSTKGEIYLIGAVVAPHQDLCALELKESVSQATIIM